MRGTARTQSGTQRRIFSRHKDAILRTAPRAEPMNINEATSVFLLAIERGVLEVEETSRKRDF